MAEKKPFVPVVAVLNMKGGVGKTTISANVFRIMFESKKIKTLLLDLDPQFNLSQALHTRTRYDGLKKQGKTIYSVMESSPSVGLFQISTAAIPTPKPSDLTHTFWRFGNGDCTLDLVAGDFDLVKYSLMDDSKKLNSVRNRFLEFVKKSRDDYGVIVIDCNPSSSFLTMCALSACTHILVPVRPDRYSLLGLEVLWKFVHDILPLSPKPEFVILLNGLPRPTAIKKMGIVESELRSHAIFGNRTLANTITISKNLEAKPDYTGFATDRKVAWRVDLKNSITKVVNEMAPKIGLK